jgi:hypothetical protein
VPEFFATLVGRIDRDAGPTKPPAEKAGPLPAS